MALDGTAPESVIHRLYGTAKVDLGHEERVGGLSAWVSPLVPLEPGQKQALRVAGERLVDQVPTPIGRRLSLTSR